MSKIEYPPTVTCDECDKPISVDEILNKNSGFSVSKRSVRLCAVLVAVCAVSLSVIAAWGKVRELKRTADEAIAIRAALMTSVSETQAMQEAEINALIYQTESVVRRLKDLDNSESRIREQVGLDTDAAEGAEPSPSAPGGVGGPAELHYAADGKMSLSDKIGYVTYLVRYSNAYMNVIEDKFTDLSVSIDDYYRYLPHMWPVVGDGCVVTSRFGWRIDPIPGEGYEYHSGIDIADAEGSDILASAAGTVVSAAYSDGFGYNVLIDHGNGYSTRYSHCSELLVKSGDTVQQGQLIAYMGSTGRSTGPHCDFRIYRDGCAVDPLTVLDSSDVCQQ